MATPHYIALIITINVQGILYQATQGVDNITYFHLKKLPSSQNVLLALSLAISKYCYDLTLLSNPDVKVKPYTTLSTLAIRNRMPAFLRVTLTSVVGKLFHHILSLHLEEFVLSNKLLDSSVQIGFLYGINAWYDGTHFQY